MLSITAIVLERKMQFLVEQCTEPYQEYGEGIAETKIVYYAKSVWQKVALPLSERHGTMP